MVVTTYDSAMARVFADEGGYTNDPKDPGGATNWGITIFDARKYWKPDATTEDVRAMPKSVAADIYRKHYADAILYDKLPAGVDYSELDAAINSGIGRAIPWMGKAIGVSFPISTADQAVTYANSVADKVSLIQRYWDVRLSFLHGLRTWSHFGAGWGRRCANGEAAAVKMWLKFGAQLPETEVKKRMGQETNTAKQQSKKSAGGAAGSVAGGSAIPSFSDFSHMPLAGKVLVSLAIVALAIVAIYMLRKMILHNQRANAYASA